MENQPTHAEAASQQEDAINLRHYWQVILERRWLVVTAFISIFILSVIYVFKAERIYQAVARLEIDREQENLLKLEGLTLGTSQEEATYLQTQYKNLMSRTLLKSVMKEVHIPDHPTYSVLNDQRYTKARDPIRKFADDITIVPIRLSRLVDIKVEHPTNYVAAAIANCLVKTFKDQSIDRKTGASIELVSRLKAEMVTEQNNLRLAEDALHAYAQTNRQVSFEDRENIALQSLKQFEADYAKAQSEAAAAEKIVATADEVLASNADIMTIPQVANNVAIEQLQRDLAAAEADFADLQRRYKSKHPLYMQMEDKVASLRNSMTEQAQNIVTSLRNTAQTAKAHELRLKQFVEEQTAAALRVDKMRAEYNVLKREAEAADLLYKTVLAKMKETDIGSRNKINNLLTIDDAEVPLKPIKPRIILTLLLGVVGGLGVAIGLAFFVNYLDDSIKSQDDIETYLRLPFLGYVPNIKTNSVVERDLQAHLHPQSNAAEGFRTVRASISLTPKAERFRVLSITSTIPSEGKSLVASNLAIVLAQTGLKTLLIDADLRRPSVHKAFQLHSPMGLSSFLTGESEQLEKIVHKTEVPNLDVVCCGAVPSTPSELIGSKRMNEFLQAARGCYDRVILDSPPISAVSDPLIIAAMSDGVVFVTKFNKIRREHARKSIQRLQDAGIHLLGIVLNDIDFEGKDSYYYSYYYYQNRYYASHYRSGTEKSRSTQEKSADLVKDRNGH